MKFRSLISKTLVVALLFSSLVGCAKKAEDKTTNTNKTTQNEKLNAPGTFPISKEKKTLSVTVVQDTNVKDWETNALTKELEEKGNVDIVFDILPAVDADKKYAVMVSSQAKLADVFMGYMKGYEEQFGGSGVFISTDKYYEDPNIAYYFNKRLEKDPKTKEFIIKNSKLADGKMYGMMMYSPEIGNDYQYRMWINQTWLTKLGLPMPKTTDEYLNTLKAFVTKDPNGNGKADEIGLIGSTNGWNQKPQEALMNAFIYTDAMTYFLKADNGKLDVVYNKREWKQGLEYMNKLVKEGVLSSSSFTQDSNQLKKIAENPDAQVIGSLAAGSLSFYTADSKRKADLVPLPPLTGPNGANFATYTPSLPKNYAYITKYCEDPELAFRVFDYMYEQKMSMWQRFGVPDVDWDTKVDGLEGVYEKSMGIKCGFKQVTDIKNVQNSLWPNRLPALRLMNEPYNIQAIAMPANRLDYTVKTAEAVPFYTDKHPKEIVSRITFTQDELAEIADIDVSLTNFRKESAVRFILGDKPFSEWDSYVKEINKIGLDKFLQVAQKAYDRDQKKK